MRRFMMLLSLFLYMKSIPGFSQEYRGKSGIKSGSKLPSFSRRMTLCGCCVLKLRWREKEKKEAAVDVCQSPEGMRGVELSSATNTHYNICLHTQIKVLSSFTVLSNPCDLRCSVEHKTRHLDGCSRCSWAMKAEKRRMTCAQAFWSHLMLCVKIRHI